MSTGSHPRKKWRRRKRPPKPIADAVVSVLRNMGLSEHAHRLTIATVWKGVVGAEIAARTQVHGFKRGVVTVKTSSAAWQNELSFLREDLIEQLNRAIGRKLIRDLRIMAGTLASQTEDQDVLPPVEPAERKRIAATAEAISDPELRARFARVMELSQRTRRAEAHQREIEPRK